MRTRILSLTVCAALGGCSLIFQNHLPSEYAGESEPFCSDSKGWAIVDVIFMALNAVGAVAAANEGGENAGLIVIGDAGFALLHAASAVRGNHWANECRDAKNDYYATPHGDPDAELRAFKQQHTKDIQVEPSQPSVPPPPRGFFCSSSPANAAVAFCVREKSECQRTHDVTLAAVPDLSACALTETAWCAGDRCVPTEEGCKSLPHRSGSDSPCTEAK